jgi:hypothetical protein
MPRTADRARVRPVFVDERIASHDFCGFEVGDLAKIQLRNDVFVAKDVASNQSQRLTTVRTVDQLLPAAHGPCSPTKEKGAVAQGAALTACAAIRSPPTGRGAGSTEVPGPTRAFHEEQQNPMTPF